MFAIFFQPNIVTFTFIMLLVKGKEFSDVKNALLRLICLWSLVALEYGWLYNFYH